MSNVAMRITYSMFDSLIGRDFLADGSGAASELAPGPAKSWTRSDDRTLELKLREGVLFDDGSELTLEDIVFSFNAARGHGYDLLIDGACRDAGDQLCGAIRALQRSGTSAAREPARAAGCHAAMASVEPAFEIACENISPDPQAISGAGS